MSKDPYLHSWDSEPFVPFSRRRIHCHHPAATVHAGERVELAAELEEPARQVEGEQADDCH
jgi:hypothetical protein